MRILNAGYSNKSKLFCSAKSNFLYDQQGVEYVDMAMGAGSLILGHAHPAIIEAVQQQSKNSTIYLQNNSVIQDLSHTLSNKLPNSLSNFIYCNTGSEATQRAVRIARAATGKMNIASFQGGWHGMNEWTLLDDGGRFGAQNIKSYAGIPEVALTYSTLLPYNDSAAFEMLESQASKIAAVIIEPIQGSNPQLKVIPFLNQLVETCRRLNILVIFDEIITGFRLGEGGAAKTFSLIPDISTYGKVLGGGLPIGLVACNDAVYEKTFGNKQKIMLTGGTFSANPLSAAAGLATLSNLNIDMYRELSVLSKYFRDHLNQGFRKHELDFSAGGVESFNRVYFTNKECKNRAQRDKFEMSQNKQLAFRNNLLSQRIIWPTNGIICLPVTQNITTLDYVIEKVIDSAKLVSRIS